MKIKDRLSYLEDRYIWDDKRYKSHPVPLRIILNILRALRLLCRDLFQGTFSKGSTGLVFTTLLSFAPLLALIFHISDHFSLEIKNDLIKTLKKALEPLGYDIAIGIVGVLESLVDFVSVGSYGGVVGLVLFAIYIKKSAHTTEDTFNRIWYLNKSRTTGEQFMMLVSTITIGSLIIVLINAVVRPFIKIVFLLIRNNDASINLVTGWPLDSISAALVFSFLYILIPNTHVRFVPALIGGVVASVSWGGLNLVSKIFMECISDNPQSYIYFIASIFLVIWLYLSWLILLIGASIAFYCQYPRATAVGPGHVYFSQTKTIEYALSLLIEIVYNLRHDSPSTSESLACEYETAPHVLAKCLDVLVDIKILEETRHVSPQYLFAVLYDEKTVSDVAEEIYNYLPEDTYEPSLSENDRNSLEAELRISYRGGEDLKDLTLKKLAQRAYGKHIGAIDEGCEN